MMDTTVPDSCAALTAHPCEASAITVSILQMGKLRGRGARSPRGQAAELGCSAGHPAPETCLQPLPCLLGPEAEDGAGVGVMEGWGVEVEVEGNHPFLFLPQSKGRNHEPTSPGIPKSSTLTHFCSMGDKVPAGWEARPLHAVSGWKGNRASWNVVSGRQLQDHTVPWPRLTVRNQRP